MKEQKFDKYISRKYLLEGRIKNDENILVK